MNIKSVVIGLGLSLGMSVCAVHAMEDEVPDNAHALTHTFDLKDTGDELAIKFFYHADIQSLGRSAQVSKRWNTLVGDSWVWEKAAELYGQGRRFGAFIKEATTILSVDKCTVYSLPTHFGVDSWKSILKDQITYLKNLSEERKTYQPIRQFSYLSFEDIKILKDQNKLQQAKEKDLGRPLTASELYLLRHPEYEAQCKATREQHNDQLTQLASSGQITSEQLELLKNLTPAQKLDMLSLVIANAFAPDSDDSESESKDGCAIM